MYSFGLKGVFIWISHILMGIYLSVFGYLVLNKKEIPQIMTLIMINLGILALLYHTHLWFYWTKKKNINNITNSNKNKKNDKNRIITTFKGKKYDLTEFVSKHPGGSIIKKANGKDLEKVWKKYNVKWHLKDKHVLAHLKEYEIKN